MRIIAAAQEAALEHKPHTYSDDDVRVRAHQIWVNNGRPEGHIARHWRESSNYWRQALAELEAEGLAQGRPVPALGQASNSPIPDPAALRHDSLESIARGKGRG